MRPPIVGMSCVAIWELAWTYGPRFREATVEAVRPEQSRIGDVVRVNEAPWAETVRVLAFLLSFAHAAVLEDFWAETHNPEVMLVSFMKQAIWERHGFVKRPHVEA